MTKNKNLVALTEQGQSVWYDNLSKTVLEDGTLESLVHSGVRGLTSNPTIFKKAIADTDEYDARIKALLNEGDSADEAAMTEALMVEDVAAAADMLSEVYKETNGDDGYASIEVSPLLAHNTEGTVSEAERLWKTLDRPNIMIKVPATKAGIPAIEELLYQGINVNVTLIFSPERYQEVAKAYCSALSRRHAEGKSVGEIASVASFFVSRVDALCEKRLSDEQRKPFLGKVGIANSKVAYSHFQSLFLGDSFASLRSAGARVQRPLWASTGTKNPEFDPLLYVQELVGEHTVNTLPPQTLELLLQSDMPVSATITADIIDAQDTVTALSDIIDFSDILRTLEEDGVQSFAQSYDELTTSVREKIAQLQE